MNNQGFSSLLMSEPPLMCLPSLAVLLGGSDEAIILQQIHYWLLRSNNIEDGYKWVYNSMENWQKQFPWIKSSKTLSKYFKDLEKRGFLVTGNYNKRKFDRTKWYRIDYDAFSNLGGALGKPYPTMGNNLPNAFGKSYPKDVAQFTQPIPETTRDYSKTTTDNNSSGKPEPHLPYKEIINYLNQKTGTRYKVTSKVNQRLIKARFNEGYTLDDFKEVIDKKVHEWGSDEKMSKFLRPATLFGTKFESYLNQKTIQHSKTPVKGKTTTVVDWDNYHPESEGDTPDLSQEEINKIFKSYADKE